VHCKTFIAFGFLLEFYSEEFSSLEMSNINFKYVRNVSIAAAVVCRAELLNLFIIKRSQDVLDVFLEF